MQKFISIAFALMLSGTALNLLDDFLRWRWHTKEYGGRWIVLILAFVLVVVGAVMAVYMAITH